MTDTTNTTAAKHYAKRDPSAQGIHYINHVSAMTTEGLHAKSAIAAELAHRDIEIERLRAALATPAQAAALVSPSDDGFMAAVNEMDGLYAAPVQTAAPDMTDAYAGAREDLSIWKKRALEAEALNRKFAASVNSPSFMGEPAALAQAGEYPELPERPEPDGFLTIEIIGRNVEINAYRDSTMEAYAYASINADRAARRAAQAAPAGMQDHIRDAHAPG